MNHGLLTMFLAMTKKDHVCFPVFSKKLVVPVLWSILSNTHLYMSLLQSCHLWSSLVCMVHIYCYHMFPCTFLEGRANKQVHSLNFDTQPDTPLNIKQKTCMFECHFRRSPPHSYTHRILRYSNIQTNKPSLKHILT